MPGRRRRRPALGARRQPLTPHPRRPPAAHRNCASPSAPHSATERCEHRPPTTIHLESIRVGIGSRSAICAGWVAHNTWLRRLPLPTVPECGHRATCWCSTGARSARCTSSARCSRGADGATPCSPTTSGDTMTALASCMEQMGGVPKTLLTDLRVPATRPPSSGQPRHYGCGRLRDRTLAPPVVPYNPWRRRRCTCPKT